MKKIMYIHPEANQRRFSEIVMPIGFIGVLNKLHLFCNVKGINIPLEKYLNANYNIYEEIKEEHIDIVLIELHWFIFSYESIEIARNIKHIFSNVKIILGGITASIYAEEIMKKYKFVDFILVGDAETALPEFIKNIDKEEYYDNLINLCYRKEEKVCKTKQTRYMMNEKIDYYSISWLKNNTYYYYLQGNMQLSQSSYNENAMYAPLAWIQNAKGCIYNCQYCGGNCKMFKTFFGYENIIYKNLVTLEEEIMILIKNGIFKYGFTHDLDMLPNYIKNSFFAFLEKISPRIAIMNCSFQLPHIDFIRRFNSVVSQENSIMSIPVLCANDSLRKSIGKNFSNNDLLEVLNAFVGTKTLVSLYFVDNLHISKTQIYETHEFIKKILHIFSDRINLDIGYGIEMLQPDSMIEKKESEMFRPYWKGFQDIYYRFSPDFKKSISLSDGYSKILGVVTDRKDIYRNIKTINSNLEKHNSTKIHKERIDDRKV